VGVAELMRALLSNGSSWWNNIKKGLRENMEVLTVLQWLMTALGRGRSNYENNV
jgi:hypothetical protein